MANNNLLPDTKKIGFLNKIKQIFRSIFYKESKSIQDTEKTIKPVNDDISQSSFIESLKEKTDIKNGCEKDALESIVEIIEENPQKIDNLTVEELEDINDYYNEKIHEVDKEINKIKKTN